MIIDQKTELYGVVGNPIGHSLSPTMHNEAFASTGRNAIYLAFETKDIEGCLRGMKALGIKGISVTLPYKSAVIPYLDKLDDLARKIGAVNTIVNETGRLVGYNTDALGGLRALEEKIELSGKNCLILGAGGAARSIGFILRDRGVNLTITNRTASKGERLARSLGCPFVPLQKMESVQTDVLIQTTPVGMSPRKDRCPVSQSILSEGMVVMDIIYNPFETKLIELARSRGCLTISGLAMFIYQGGEQFRLWTGIEPPFSPMTRAVKEALLSA